MKNLHRSLGIALVVPLMALLPAPPCSAQCTTTLPQGVLAVDSESQAQNPDGRSWECAFITLQEALDVASAGDQIWVAASATPYTPSAIFDPNDDPGDIQSFVTPCSCDADNRRITFRLVKNVSLYGGFLGNAHPSGGETDVSEADPANNITTLSGDLGSLHAFHVLTYFQNANDTTPASLTMIVDGFVITDGVATGGDDSSPYDGALNALGGGALVVYEAHELLTPPGPVFSRCVFKDNVAELGGGAIGGYYGGVRVTDCRFENNTHNATSGTEFSGKTTRGGGAINVQGPVAVLKCTFVENTSVTGGGAVHHAGAAGDAQDGTFLVSNCKFYANQAPTGGAIDELGSTAAGIVVNSLFVGNVADDGRGGGDGGALAGGVNEAHGCTFVENEASNHGGGVAGVG